MQNDILFAILMSLLAHPCTAPELATKYELSIRSVYRYLDTLEMAGVPLMRRVGCKGGYYLDSSHIIDKTYFSLDEYQYLLGLSAGARFGGKIADSVAEKIAALARIRANSGYSMAPETLVIDSDSWCGGANLTISTLQCAIERSTALDIVYVDSSDLRTERRILPHTLVLKGNMWYVYAYCTLRTAWRLFAISRIESVMEREHFTRLGYDLDAVPWRTHAIGNDVNLVLRFSANARATLLDRFGNACVEGDIATIRVPLTKSLARDLLRYGNAVEILEPEELRDEIKELLHATCALYKE